MNNQKAFKFAYKSLAWSLLLYVITFTALNWDQVQRKVNGENDTVVVQEKTDNSNISYRVSVDSLQRNIQIAGNVFRKIRTALSN